MFKVNNKDNRTTPMAVPSDRSIFKRIFVN